jgi:hypothetical protein
VAFVAATVNVDDAPEEIEVGFAVMLTVGNGFEPPEPLPPPHPLNSMDIGRQVNRATE